MTSMNSDNQTCEGLDVSITNTDARYSVRRHEETNKSIPAVSVIVPIYNASYTLVQALQSLSNQTFDDIEIICVNDGSTDDSLKIIEGFYSKDNRFVIVENAKNSGYGAAMNNGKDVARGLWLAILEPDDYVKEDMFEKMLAFVYGFEEALENKIDIIKTPYIREVRDEGVKRGDTPKEYLNCSYKGRINPKSQPFDMSDKNVAHLLRHHPSIWTALYRRDFMVDKGIRFVEYPGSGWADNEFFYKTLLAADSIVYLDEAFYIYREETEQEFETFARNNKTLPFDRWHSMTKIVESSGYGNDEGVIGNHICKGFTYLAGLIDANTDEQGNTDPIVIEEMCRMFAEMDPDAVARETKVRPDLKDRYFAYIGGKPRSGLAKMVDHGMYYGGLVEELVYTLNNNGVDYTIKQIKKVIER